MHVSHAIPFYVSLFLHLVTCISARNLFPLFKAGQQPLSSPKKSFDIPEIGLGLWNSKDKLATDSVAYGFDAGYHHFDSAAAYSNEQFVGTGLSASNVSRSSYWITSKLWNDAHKPSHVEGALRKTLSDLNTTYLDLYLMHWPVAFVPGKGSRTIIDEDTSIVDTWHAMEDLVRQNLTRHIGISNFSPRQIDQVLKECKICPYAHEYETHPYLQQTEFLEWHLEHDIKVIAYSPLGNLNPTYNGTHSELPPIVDDPFWQELAAKKNATVAQAVLAWNMQRGAVVIPKSTHQHRIAENLGSLKTLKKGFSNDEIMKILEQDKRARFNNPSKGWGVELFEGLDGGSNRFLAVDEMEL